MVSGQSSTLGNGDGAGAKMRIVVAVDFGTTFSAVAYANTLNPSLQKLLTNWGNGGNMTQDSVPTVLRYDNDGTTGPYVWGFRAQQYIEYDKKVHEWFKLGLCNNFEERRARESEFMRKYKSQTALPPVKDGDEVCKNLVVDFLRGVKEAVDDFFYNTLDESVARCPRDYIITVPALWDHAEQEKTRQCAERAGMGEGTQLQIISEPEAACIYAIQTMLTMKVHDTFIICDAGGGTVDLASYTIEFLSLNPFHCKLAGAGTGSGGLCGSSFLNRIFEKYLRDKLEDYYYWDQNWNPDIVIAEASKAFENRIKPNFTGEGAEEHFIKIQGLASSKRHGIIRNFLVLTTAELREKVFDEVITKIQGLVRDEIAHTRGTVKEVLLAGGFGKNPYLKKKLQEIDSVVKQKIGVQQIENSDTVIARVALLAGLSGISRSRGFEDDGGSNAAPTGTEVTSRISGRHYGTTAYYDFEEGKDEERRKEVVIRDDGAKIEKIQWFAKKYIRKGDSLPDGQPKSFKFFKLAKVRPGVPAYETCTPNIHIYTCEKNSSVDYKDDPAVWEIARFKLDLRGLEIPTKWVNGERFYEAEFVVEMVLHSASLSFCGVYGKGTPCAKRFPVKYVQF